MSKTFFGGGSPKVKGRGKREGEREDGREKGRIDGMEWEAPSRQNSGYAMHIIMTAHHMLYCPSGEKLGGTRPLRTPW